MNLKLSIEVLLKRFKERILKSWEKVYWDDWFKNFWNLNFEYKFKWSSIINWKSEIIRDKVIRRNEGLKSLKWLYEGYFKR